MSALETDIRRFAHADGVEIVRLERLRGGAIQHTYALDVRIDGGPLAGTHAWVARTNAPSQVAASRTRAEEFAVLTVAYRGGVRVPRPMFACDDPAAFGSPYFVMARVDGIAAAHRLVREDTLVPDRARLAFELGANLALLHAVPAPVAALPFLTPHGDPVASAVERARADLDALGAVRPVLEWGISWFDAYAPRTTGMTLNHRDYRTGNYLVRDGALAAVLDWEFADYGDPHEDVGWFFAKCWRFGKTSRRAGGIGDAADFLHGYASVAVRELDPASIDAWEVMAHIRWAIIALQQAERHLGGGEPSLELALTGRIVPELELEVLALTQQTA